MVGAVKCRALKCIFVFSLQVVVMYTVRVTLGRGLTAARFRWVPFVDALMFPLRNERLKSEDPDRKVFYMVSMPSRSSTQAG